MSHHIFKSGKGFAHNILEMTHYILLYRANDPFALFYKMNPAKLYVSVYIQQESPTRPSKGLDPNTLSAFTAG